MPAASSPDPSPAGAGFGVYVHVPFCAHRCDYCDFATWTDRAHLMRDYVDACVRDLAARRVEGHPPATSVFFGGGTPSLLPAAELVRVLDAIERAPGAEVTVECNPDSVDAAKLRTYTAAGVNRLSFGAQSFSPHVLRALGRTHDPANVARAVALARDAGITDLNVDCIYGTPGETLDDWRRTLDSVVALGVPHVSAYALTVEPGTPLGRRVAAGAAPAPDDDDQADKYLLADEVLGAAGYEWYEISNFARPGAQCRHNRCYWEQGEYLGIGCAAHGHTGGRRWWNVRTPERYVTRVVAGRSPEAGHERLGAAARAEEAVQLALRTRRGAVVAGPAVEDLRAAGLLEPGPGPAVLSRRGRLLASEVTARLVLAAGPGLVLAAGPGDAPAAGPGRAGGAGTRVP